MAAQDRLKTFGDNDLDIQNCDKAEAIDAIVDPVLWILEVMRSAVSKL